MDRATADRIALKTMVGAVALTHQVDEGESIIPIQEEGKTAFVYYFSIVDEGARGGERICTLSFVVDRKDGVMLYRFAPVLSEYSKKIVQDIRKYYVYRQPLPQVLINSLESILSIEDFEKSILPDSFREYLIRSYLSKDTTFHHSLLEKTKNISRREEILGEKVDIVGRDKNRNIVWVLLSHNFSRMSDEEKQDFYLYLDKLRENIPSLEVIFVLNELGLRKGGAFDEKAIEGIAQVSRISEVEGKAFDLYGTDNNDNIIWALLSKNFLVMSESEIDELNKKIYQLKRENPSMEAFFVLAEVLRTAKIQPQNLDLEGKPAKLEKIKKVKNEYQSLKKSIKESKS